LAHDQRPGPPDRLPAKLGRSAAHRPQQVSQQGGLTTFPQGSERCDSPGGQVAAPQPVEICSPSSQLAYWLTNPPDFGLRLALAWPSQARTAGGGWREFGHFRLFHARNTFRARSIPYIGAGANTVPTEAHGPTVGLAQAAEGQA